jgi:FKBP-type peptidyl-prolyl cis-trans isomerase
MANKGQKIFIWVIAVTMLVGSIGASFLVILANDNQAKEVKDQQAELAKYQEAQQAEVEKQQARMKLPAKPLPGYKADAFNASSVKSLAIKDLKTGKGKTVKADSVLKVNYFGWLSNGRIFDSTNRGGKVESVEFGLDGTIDGWIKGMTGAKEGAVRRLTIPASMAYGSEKKASIPANSPLMFIVEILKVD